MDIFLYKGRNKRGEVMQGTIESPNQHAVVTWMMNSGIAPISIELQGDEISRQPAWLRELTGANRVALRDLLLFTRQLGTMVKSGVPLMQGLASIQKSTPSPALVEALRLARADLERGHSLASSLGRQSHVFDDYYVSMVRVGEDTGRLDESLQRLHAQLEFEKYMKQKIKGALRYPLFVVVAVAVAIAIMTLFVIPVFAKIYEKFHADLPPLTVLLVETSNFTVQYWWLVLGALVATIYALYRLVQIPSGRYMWDKLKLRIPVAGSIIKKATLARFCRSFASACKSGVPLVQAFTLVSRVVDNAFYEERILQMRDGVERGDSLLRVAQTAGIFSPLELQMISVGEDTGDVDGMLNQVANMYQEEVEYEVERLAESIQPILMVFLGALVLILMLGVFLPMWGLGEAALRHR
jgi:MSHA biogenesis protein MshG